MLTDELAERNRERARQHQHQNLVGRFAICLARGKGSTFAAADEARRSYPYVEPLRASLEAVQKVATDPGDTNTPAWGGVTVRNPALVAFLDMLRARTIVDRLPGVRKVPLNVSVPVQTAAGTYKWVGEGIGKPAGALTFDSATLYWSKCSGILACTRELLQFGSNETEQIVQNDLAAGSASFLDTEFISTNPAINYVAPGGILSGVAPVSSSAGTSAANFRTDMKNLIAALATTVKDLRGTVILMNPTNAINLNLMGAEFSTLGADGGTIAGLPCLTSDAVGSRLVAIHAPSVLLADAGVELALSTETSVELDTAPSVGDTSPLSSVTRLTSAFQANVSFFRVDRMINWRMARSGCVKYIINAAYGV
jgi:hypothetical protein